MRRIGLLSRAWRAAAMTVFFMAQFALPAHAQDCAPPEPPLQNFTGGGQVTCPCFVAGEEAGTVLNLPAGDFPIEVLRIGVAWASQFGGQPQTLEQAVKIYPAGLPSPGVPLFELQGPVMTDGFFNEWDISAAPVRVEGGPFMVTLKFNNSNSGNVFAPSVVHDGNGCQPGKNSIYAIPGGWIDACAVGLTGDWVMYVVYRPDCTATGVEMVATNAPVLLGPSPNPFGASTRIEFQLPQDTVVDIAVYDVRGRRVAAVEDGAFAAGRHGVLWDGRGDDGSRLPSGTYFVRMIADGVQTTRKISLLQ